MSSLPVGEERRIHWFGPAVPVAGDVLETTTGRRYLVQRVGGRVTLHCVVVPATMKATRSMRWLKRNPFKR